MKITHHKQARKHLDNNTLKRRSELSKKLLGKLLKV